MGLRPCSGNCLARVIGGVVGTRGGPDGLNDNAAGLGRRYVLELRSNYREQSSPCDKVDQGRLRESRRHCRPRQDGFPKA